MCRPLWGAVAPLITESMAEYVNVDKMPIYTKAGEGSHLQIINPTDLPNPFRVMDLPFLVQGAGRKPVKKWLYDDKDVRLEVHEIVINKWLTFETSFSDHDKVHWQPDNCLFLSTDDIPCKRLFERVQAEYESRRNFGGIVLYVESALAKYDLDDVVTSMGLNNCGGLYWNEEVKRQVRNYRKQYYGHSPDIYPIDLSRLMASCLTESSQKDWNDKVNVYELFNVADISGNALKIAQVNSGGDFMNRRECVGFDLWVDIMSSKNNRCESLKGISN